jgi:hypothetical protein
MQAATTANSVDRDPIQILCAPRIEAKMWVRLLQLPSAFSFDEAFLLCQVSFDEWLAWIPDHGEARLHVSQFECLA